jgi:hypothetical protein
MEEIKSSQSQEENKESTLGLKPTRENCHEIKNTQNLLHLNFIPKNRRVLYQNDILQNIFRFHSLWRSFETFRLVCKSWKNAIETIKLDDQFDSNCFFSLKNQFSPKFLQTFKHFRISHFHLKNASSEEWEQHSEIILNNMHKLTKFTLWTLKEPLPLNFQTFLFNFLQNSKNTLKEFGIESNSFIFPPIFFPNLEKIWISLRLFHDDVEKFKSLMENILKFCKNIKKITIFDISKAPQLSQYIVENYSKHCISGTYQNLEFVPLKIATDHDCLLRRDQELEQNDCRYSSCIQYLRFWGGVYHPDETKWQEFTTVCSYCPNLKFILDNRSNQLSEIEENKNLPNDKKNIWRQRILYLKSKGYTILPNKYAAIKFEEFRYPIGWGFVLC